MFFPSRAFVEMDGKIYFFRSKNGPTYRVTPEERKAITSRAYRLHYKMAAVIVASFVAFGIFILLLPSLLDLPFDFAMIVMVGLVVLSLTPLAFMLKFHLDFQRQVRAILGPRTAIDFGDEKGMSEKPEKGKTKKPATEGSLMTAVRKRERKVRFFFVFFMGVIMTTVGAVMLFGSEELSTKMLFIWALWLMTGLGLLAVGFIGLWVRYSDTKLEGSPRDDQNDQPEKSE